MLLIKNCIVVSEVGERNVDVKIKDGMIEKVDNVISDANGYKLLDAKGLYLLPSIIDLNIRILDDTFNMPNLKKLYESMKKGGVGSFVLSPRFFPLVENQTFMQLLGFELNKNYQQLVPAIKALKNIELTKLNDIATLSKYGINIIQENSNINGNLIRRIMQYAKMNDSIFFTFCQNQDLNDSGVMNEGEVSFKLGIPGISKIGEISEVAKMVQFSQYYRVKTHFQALSTKEALDIVHIAKEKFKSISSEVSIHHLILDDTYCDDYNTYAKINPPLRENSQKEALLTALKEGKIDTITSLHSPKSVLFKDVAFAEAMFGIDVIEDFMALCYTYLVKDGVISLYELTKLISLNPAKILGFEKVGVVEEGYEANFMIFNPNSLKTIENLQTPYSGKIIHGSVETIINKGEIEISYQNVI